MSARCWADKRKASRRINSHAGERWGFHLFPSYKFKKNRKEKKPKTFSFVYVSRYTLLLLFSSFHMRLDQLIANNFRLACCCIFWWIRLVTFFFYLVTRTAVIISLLPNRIRLDQPVSQLPRYLFHRLTHICRQRVGLMNVADSFLSASGVSVEFGQAVTGRLFFFFLRPEFIRQAGLDSNSF